MREFDLDLGQDWWGAWHAKAYFLIWFYMLLPKKEAVMMRMLHPVFQQTCGFVSLGSPSSRAECLFPADTCTRSTFIGFFSVNYQHWIIWFSIAVFGDNFHEAESKTHVSTIRPHHRMNFWVWYFNTEFICSYLWDVNRVSGKNARKEKNPSNTRLLYVNFEVKLHFMVKSGHSRSAARFTIIPNHGAALVFPT